MYKCQKIKIPIEIIEHKIQSAHIKYLSLFLCSKFYIKMYLFPIRHTHEFN